MEPIRIIKTDILVGAHSGDWHFGVFNPQLQYQILSEQFITPLTKLNKLDYVTINGDIFDHKYMSNSDAIMFAIRTIDELIARVIKPKNATLLILAGTWSHDSGQLKLFYHYMRDISIDVRVVETMKFEYVKGAKILCIPELSNVPEEEYQKYLFRSGLYDVVHMHGTIKGSVMGDNPGSNTRLFTIEDFALCKGPVISGHIHTGGCFNKYFYYCGTPYTFRFGENNDKGFLISMQNLDTRQFYIKSERIYSFRYDTISGDDLINNDPKDIIDYINNVKETQNIDYIRIVFNNQLPQDKKSILNTYYRNNKNVVFKYNSKIEDNIKKVSEKSDMYGKYEFLYNNAMNPYQKFVQYVNDQEGCEFITVDKLTKILEDG